MPGMTEAEQYIFDTSGVLIRRRAFDPAVTGIALQRIKDTVEPDAWKFPILDISNIFWEWMVADCLFQPAMEMCGPHIRLDHAFGVRGGSISKAPAQLHGGPDSSQYSCFYHDVGKPVGLVGQLSVGVTLKGQTPDTGGFCYLPGSHKAKSRVDGRHVFDELLNRDVDHSAIVVPFLQPGDLIFFSESLVHGDTGVRPRPHPTPFTHERVMAYYKFSPGWMCWRDPAQQAKYRTLANCERAVRLLEPPWTGRFDDDNHTMSTKNTRRGPTA